MIPTTHHGNWSGPNRLWVTDPENPFRSDGTLGAAEMTVSYTWTYKDKPQRGVINLSGQPAALKGEWKDTWHAGDGITMHGLKRDGIVYLYGTYPAGEGHPDWGWQIELDTRDREAFVMRMFNVVPDIGPVPAVILHGTR